MFYFIIFKLLHMYNSLKGNKYQILRNTDKSSVKFTDLFFHIKLY